MSDRGTEVLIKVINHYWDNLDNYDSDTLESSMRIMQLDPDQVEEEVRKNPTIAQLIGEQIFELEEEESEEESLPEEEEEIQNQSDDEESSDDESKVHIRMNRQDPEDPIFPKKEEGETSAAGAKKRKAQKPIFMPQKPKMVQGNNLDSSILNIDCQDNRKELIDRWAGEMSLIIQTNPDAYSSDAKVRSLLEHKSVGIVESFIKKTTWVNTDPEGALRQVIEALYSSFLGLNFINDKDAELEKLKTKAKNFLIRMTLCDICELADFNCAFEKRFHDLDQTDWTKFIELYFVKIPHVGEQAYKRFEQEAKPPMHMSLGFAMKLVSEEIGKICETSKNQKRFKKFNKKCCNILNKEITDFGCKPEKKRFSKKRFKKSKKRKTFKKYRRKFTPGKYFKPKGKTDKSKFCPKGKKNCRCWICSEEGHYANECPNRKQYSDKVKLIEYAENNGLEPIEESFTGIKEVYYLVLEEPPDSEESSEDSSDEESE
uniref:Coat protein n=1 Tax=Physostegia virginiana caulimovirus 1 TaxID=3075963 RepID=A0AA96C3J1_9VIRU|nr:coat protein [Physostegia virginiana caulimovirus 1]